MWGAPWPAAWGEHEAAAKEIEACAAEHLALEHFQAIDLTLHWPITPPSRGPHFDRGIIVHQPSGKPLESSHRAGGGSFQPGIKPCSPPPAHEVGKILRQLNRLGQLGLLRA